MLPRYIIVGVFSALISQGNIATALPQESQFNARFEHIADSKAAAVIDTRAADRPESGALTGRTAPEYMDPEVAALISRELEKRIPWYSVISTVSSCISLYKVGKELVEWVPKANVGKMTDDQIKKLADYLFRSNCNKEKYKVEDIEMALTAREAEEHGIYVLKKSKSVNRGVA